MTRPATWCRVVTNKGAGGGVVRAAMEGSMEASGSSVCEAADAAEEEAEELTKRRPKLMLLAHGTAAWAAGRA